MDPKRWSKPVEYQAGQVGPYRSVGNTRDAARLLTERWPATTGRKFIRAKKTFSDVLDGKRPPSEARAAFIEAANEANVAVRVN